MRFVVLVAVPWSLLLVACSTPLTVGGRGVRVVKSDLPLMCEDLGTVESADPSPDDTRNEIRNDAAEMGANFVRLDSTTAAGYGLIGTAYRCPAEAFSPTPSAPPEGPAPTSEPDPIEDGTAGGACYGNGTCNSGLVCSEASMCVETPDGAEGGACYGNGTCNDGLSCLADRCSTTGEAETPRASESE